jgi:hypothetical protein
MTKKAIKQTAPINTVTEAQAVKVRKPRVKKIDVLPKFDARPLLLDVANAVSGATACVKGINSMLKQADEMMLSLNTANRKLYTAGVSYGSLGDESSNATALFTMLRERGMTEGYAKQAVYCVVHAFENRVEMQLETRTGAQAYGFNKDRLVKQMALGLPDLVNADTIRKIGAEDQTKRGAGGRPNHHVSKGIVTASEKAEFCKVIRQWFEMLEARDATADDDILETMWLTFETMGHAEKVTKNDVTKWAWK